MSAMETSSSSTARGSKPRAMTSSIAHSTASRNEGASRSKPTKWPLGPSSTDTSSSRASKRRSASSSDSGACSRIRNAKLAMSSLLVPECKPADHPCGHVRVLGRAPDPEPLPVRRHHVSPRVPGVPHLDHAPLLLGEAQRPLDLLPLMAGSGHVDNGNGNGLPWTLSTGSSRDETLQWRGERGSQTVNPLRQPPLPRRPDPTPLP